MNTEIEDEPLVGDVVVEPVEPPGDVAPFEPGVAVVELFGALE